ncbi:MAG TPA: ATP-dependent DNA ligase, partial [Actinomycetota bacterium]|nr:ATP-dependent DNA ligase [Actinomycetota bacterium]
MSMLLAELVGVSRAVAATSSRSAKIATLADLLRQADPEELPIVVGLLTGEPRQGRVGVGWASVSKVVAEPAPAPSVTLGEIDRA